MLLVLEARSRPVVGSVMRDMILSRVDLPAPFRPTMPMMSPRSTSNVTSRSAQKVSVVGLSAPAVLREQPTSCVRRSIR